jgi:hypothetical protein
MLNIGSRAIVFGIRYWLAILVHEAESVLLHGLFITENIYNSPGSIT